MKLDIGSEKRFFEFIGKLGDKDKIALISHTDLDGVIVPYVANKVVAADILLFLNYEDLNHKLVLSLKGKKVNKIIFTDLYIKDENFLKELEKFAEVLILDHHLAKKDWNSDKITFIKCEEGYCAGYLCYELFSKIQNLEKIDWLVACACVADYCHVKTIGLLEKVFAKYGDKFEMQGLYVRMSGKICELQEALSLALIYFKPDKIKNVFDALGEKFGDIRDMGKYSSQVKNEVSRLVELFNKEKQTFPGGYLFEFTPKYGCGSMVSTILSGKYIDKIIITLRPDSAGKIYHVSLRRQDRKQNMDAFLVALLKGFKGADGGGHVPAAGGYFPTHYLNEFRQRLGVKV